MNADGSDVRRLTDQPGYDGGPFYSADGEKIVWRRFAEDGHSAEVYTANADGTGEKRITDLGAMSWAPYFHPSGDYVIFATSVHGFANFELYLVDAEGEREPVRVTSHETFDSLPVFSPDGGTLAWASSRTADKKPQLFTAAWNDEAARKLLGLEEKTVVLPGEVPPLPDSVGDISADDLRRHVEALASEAMDGAADRQSGEQLATDYVAKAFERLGLEPAGDDGSWFQPFEFTAGVSLGDGNRLAIDGIDASIAVDRDWRPLGMSKEGELEPGGVTFAGYGVVAPEGDGHQSGYDSYAGLDVRGAVGHDLSPSARGHRLGTPPASASLCRPRLQGRGRAGERGAVGLIVVSGPSAEVKDELVPLSFDAATAGSSLGGCFDQRRSGGGDALRPGEGSGRAAERARRGRAGAGLRDPRHRGSGPRSRSTRRCAPGGTCWRASRPMTARIGRRGRDRCPCRPSRPRRRGQVAGIRRPDRRDPLRRRRQRVRRRRDAGDRGISGRTAAPGASSTCRATWCSPPGPARSSACSARTTSSGASPATSARPCSRRSPPISIST